MPFLGDLIKLHILTWSKIGLSSEVKKTPKNTCSTPVDTFLMLNTLPSRPCNFRYLSYDFHRLHA